MKKYFLLALMTILIMSCSDKVDETKNQADSLGTIPEGHPPVSGRDALSELSDDAPSFDPANPVLELSDISFTAPDNWVREQPTSQMRVVQYSLKNSPETKVVGFFFGQQDLLRENIDRWKKEFSELKNSKEEKLMGDKVTMVVLEGVYNVKAFPMAQEFTATPDYMVLAAVVQSSDGPYYFKVYAPSKILKAELPNFKKFLSSYKVKAQNI